MDNEISFEVNNNVFEAFKPEFELIRAAIVSLIFTSLTATIVILFSKNKNWSIA